MINLNLEEATVILKYITYTECTLASLFQNDNNTHFWQIVMKLVYFKEVVEMNLTFLESNQAIELRACDYYHTSRIKLNK